MDFAQAYNLVTNTAQYNNAWSAEQAQKQIDFQREMSNSAHQREVADLKAAGLNPVLSAKLGGASTPTGAAASADSSLTGAVLQLVSQALEANTMSAAALYRGAGSSGSSDEPELGPDVVLDVNGKPRVKYNVEVPEVPTINNPRTKWQIKYNAAATMINQYRDVLSENASYLQSAFFPNKIVSSGKAKGRTTSKSNTGSLKGTWTSAKKYINASEGD